jgi:hypothetical protein
MAPDQDVLMGHFIDSDLRKPISQHSPDAWQSSGGQGVTGLRSWGCLRRELSSSGMEGPDHPVTLDPGSNGDSSLRNDSDHPKLNKTVYSEVISLAP